MAFTKFKLLTQRLLSGLGKTKSFFPFYDSENDADYRVSLDTLITFISNELGVSSKAVFELTGVSNTGNNYVSTLDISSYKTEGLYIFKPSADSDNVTTLNVNTVGILNIKEFDGTSIVDKTDLKAVNTYLLLNKTSYWLVVGGVNGGTGGVSTFSALTDSPYDNTLLAEALDSKQDKPNGVLTGCTITLGSYGGSGSNNDIRVTEGTWRISPSEYSNVGTGNTDFLDIALSASGLQRYVELVGTNVNTIIKIEGAENAIAVRPTLGAGQTSLGSILVKDALIDPPVPDLSGYLPLSGGIMTGNIKSSNSFFQLGLNDDTSYIQFINTLLTLKSEVGNFSSETKNESFTDGRYTIIVNDSGGVGRQRSLEIRSNQPAVFSGDVISYNADRTTEIDANGNALINRDYADAHYLGGGVTNLGYTPSPTNGIVTSDTGTDATIPLVDGTNAGLVSPSMKSTWDGKQEALTAANFATFVNSTTDKTTPVDADIVPTIDVSTGKRFSLSNLWTNYLKPKADAIYATISNLNLKMNLSMSARTIKLNKTASTANGIDGSVTDLMELMAGCTDNTGSGALLAISTTNTKAIRFTSGASILRSFAGGTDGAILVCQNSSSALMSVNHEDTAETTVANRINTGGQNVQVGIGGVFVFQYKTSNSRWNLIGGNGLNYWSVFAGSSNRLVEVDANGLGSATKTFIALYITDSTNITNLETTANWTAGVYGGATIAGETKGKVYYGTLYMYVMITASTPKRIIYT